MIRSKMLAATVLAAAVMVGCEAEEVEPVEPAVPVTPAPAPTAEEPAVGTGAVDALGEGAARVGEAVETGAAEAAAAGAAATQKAGEAITAPKTETP